jgi:hypothetical protein
MFLSLFLISNHTTKSKPLNIKTVIIGGNFVGFIAALELKRKAGLDVNITGSTAHLISYSSLPSSGCPSEEETLKTSKSEGIIYLKEKGFAF